MRGWWWVPMGVLALNGCGGGGSNAAPAAVTSGGLVESCLKAPTVAGLPFFTDVEENVTDSTGCFSFTLGHPVTFFVGVRSGTVVQGNELGTVNAVGGTETDFQSLAADATTQANLASFLLVARSNDVMTDGIVLAPTFLAQAALLPQFNFAQDISADLPSVQSAGVASKDGGTHAVATASSGQALLDAGALCSMAGSYSGLGLVNSGESSSGTQSIAVQFLVSPPSDTIAGLVEVSVAGASVVGSVPFQINQPLSVSAPVVTMTSGGVGIVGTLAPGQFFSGTTSYLLSTGLTGTTTVLAGGSGLTRSTRRYVGGSLGTMGEYGAAIEVYPVPTPGSLAYVGNVYGLAASTGQFTGTLEPDGTDDAVATGDGLTYTVQITSPDTLELTVKTSDGLVLIQVSLSGCMR